MKKKAAAVLPRLLLLLVQLGLSVSLSLSDESSSGFASPFPYLPPLLELSNGSAVTSSKVWEEVRRGEIKDLLGTYILGTAPDKRPALLKATLVNSTSIGTSRRKQQQQQVQDDNDSDNDSNNNVGTSKFFFLEFERSLSFYVEIVVPASLTSPQGGSAESAESGQSPLFPVFMTQWNHREWALLGVNRGYVGVVYPGADTRDAAPRFQQAYPDHTMMLIRARALVASCALDFVLDPPEGQQRSFGVSLNDSQVCVTGHSRNGKQSLIFAAHDERVSAVVGSSPGAPISSPYHFSSHNFYGEGPDAGQAGHWWLPGIVNFTAHPETLPMDGHGVLALVAPRAMATAVGWTDQEGSISFAAEMNILASKEVYERLYGTESLRKLRIIHRPGGHHGFDDVNSYFDWFDISFGRITEENPFRLGWAGPGMLTSTDPTDHMITPAAFSWDVWFQAFQPHPPAPSKNSNLEQRVRWLLQLSNTSEGIIHSAGSSYNEMQNPSFLYTTYMLRRIPDTSLKFQTFSFGDYVTGMAYWKDLPATEAPALRPVVVWLHPYSYSTGFTSSYGTEPVHFDLAKAGYVSIAFDQVGFATRVLEGGTSFYARHGRHASLFGHMVRDARAAVDVAECLGTDEQRLSPACGTGEMPGSTYPAQTNLREVPNIDTNHIYLAGYSLGGNVALHAAMLDKRVAGTAAFAAFTPMRTDTNDKPTLGLRRLYDYHAILPRLGLFANRTQDVPYDYDELISAIAPRPVFLFTPQQDRDATYSDVAACVGTIAQSYSKQGASGNLTTVAPNVSTGMTSAETDALLAWLKNVTGGVTV